MSDYLKTVKLKHNQTVAIVNEDSGEITEIKERPNNIPEDKRIHKYTEFSKVNSKAMKYLEKILSNEELGIVTKMINKADYESNIMIPLNNETSYRKLAEEFNISRNKVKNIFTKLFNLGVYAQIKVANGYHSEYWTLNPYLSWKGKFIEKSISTYFCNTILAKQVIM